MYRHVSKAISTYITSRINPEYQSLLAVRNRIVLISIISQLTRAIKPNAFQGLTRRGEDTLLIHASLMSSPWLLGKLMQPLKYEMVCPAFHVVELVNEEADVS